MRFVHLPFRNSEAPIPNRDRYNGWSNQLFWNAGAEELFSDLAASRGATSKFQIFLEHYWRINARKYVAITLKFVVKGSASWVIR